MTVGDRTSSASTMQPSKATEPLESMSQFHINETFFLLPTDEKDVLTTCMSIKSKQSTGHDDLSNFLVKRIIHNIVKPLTHIFNISFQTGIFPDG